MANFGMADFISEFWHWFIIVGTLGGIIYCTILLVVNNGKNSRRDAEGKVDTTGHVWDEDIAEYDNPLPRWWANMYILLVVFGIIYLILYPGLGKFQGVLDWSQKQQYEDEVAKVDAIHEPLLSFYAEQPIPELAHNLDAMKTGKRLFQTYCSTCHGSDMRGNKGFPNLRDDDWLYGSDPEVITQTLLNGRMGVMPAWAKQFGGDVDNVINYVYSMNEYPEVREFVTMSGNELEIGKQRYEQNCVVCHGHEGKGNLGLAPNLVDNIWLHGGDMETLMDVVNNGRNGVMPAFEKLLGEDQVHVLAAYVYRQAGLAGDIEPLNAKEKKLLEIEKAASDAN
jgi:cytochrome c oxidase, cbb3-type, subunit III